MNLYLLLELAVGDIRRDVTSPASTLGELIEYSIYNQNLNSMLLILDRVANLEELHRQRYILVPFGLSFTDTIAHINMCTASAYRDTIPTEAISLNDWLRTDGWEITLETACISLRRALLEYILGDSSGEYLDDYIFRLYQIIIKSLISAS